MYMQSNIYISIYSYMQRDIYHFPGKALSEAVIKYLSMIINNQHALVCVIRCVKYFLKPTTHDLERKCKALILWSRETRIFFLGFFFETD